MFVKHVQIQPKICKDLVLNLMEFYKKSKLINKNKKEYGIISIKRKQIKTMKLKTIIQNLNISIWLKTKRINLINQPVLKQKILL